jgi:hypothetical protein
MSLSTICGPSIVSDAYCTGQFWPLDHDGKLQLIAILGRNTMARNPPQTTNCLWYLVSHA